MSARDELDAAMKRGTFLMHERERLIDAYAHELAEKQRAFEGPSMTMAGRTMVPLGMVADLIDPEVLNSDG